MRGYNVNKMVYSDPDFVQRVHTLLREQFGISERIPLCKHPLLSTYTFGFSQSLGLIPEYQKWIEQQWDLYQEDMQKNIDFGKKCSAPKDDYMKEVNNLLVPLKTRYFDILRGNNTVVYSRSRYTNAATVCLRRELIPEPQIVRQLINFRSEIQKLGEEIPGLSFEKRKATSCIRLYRDKRNQLFGKLMQHFARYDYIHMFTQTEYLYKKRPVYKATKEDISISILFSKNKAFHSMEDLQNDKYHYFRIVSDCFEYNILTGKEETTFWKLSDDELAKIYNHYRSIRRLCKSHLFQEKVERWREELWKPYGKIAMRTLEEAHEEQLNNDVRPKRW